MVTRAALQKRIRQARGVDPADCVLKDCRLIDVCCGEIVRTDVAICDDRIAGTGNYSGVQEIDCKGAYICPGFMEGHIHIESSMLSPKQFARAVLPHGTTTVVCDPHEIANVAGIAGINFILEESSDLLCRFYLMAPSCVPATHLETSGAFLGSGEIEQILKSPRVIGIAEMMNFPGVLFEDDEVLKKLILSEKMDIPMDGHAPGLGGKDLQAYIGCRIMSDHECTTAEEASEKLRSGMFLFIREGSTAKNLSALLPVVTRKNSHRCLLVTDDCHPHDLVIEGHLDRILRKAIKLGLDPITAIQMVTINVANYFNLNDRGAVVPGYRADLVLFDDLADIRPKLVFSGGQEVAVENSSKNIDKKKFANKYPEVFDSVHVETKTISFSIPARAKCARVVRVLKDQLITEEVELPVKIVDGMAVADPENDIIKMAVVERHKATGNIGLGFVQGFGLQRGALASTVGHDSHNITVIGVDDRDMMLAVETIVGHGGGLAVVVDGRVLASLPLPIGGLMSAADALEVSAGFSSLLQAAAGLGGFLADPFMHMSFLSLSVIPHLKMTDLGLVDVDTFQHVGLWV
ncbi:MAG: adenine deaminase [Proteobacteria bacterium]|nr:adenine deaminase [Pseudomonadota bacterium]MBU1420405.1 adenine deaminase [Pseudomonadota bacterium]MBU1454415.1 adenine deaminase [Pseudomonadota bacterium]